MSILNVRKKIRRLLFWTVALTLVCVCSHVEAQDVNGQMGEQGVEEVLDGQALRLKMTFEETANLIRNFEAGKQRYIGNPNTLRRELSKVSSTYLEPLRRDAGAVKSLTPRQEAAALQSLRNSEEYAAYADSVWKLWNQTRYAIPLAPLYIAKTIAPDTISALTSVDMEDEETDASGSGIGGVIGVVGILLVGGFIVLHIVRRRKEERAEQECRRQEAEEAARRRAEMQRRAEEEARLPELEEVKNANDYSMEQFVCSKDLGRDIFPLEKPVRRQVKAGYVLQLVNADGEAGQRFALTKAVVSFGRRGQGAGCADIAFNVEEDQDISRAHGVLIYQESEDDEFWLLAINQGSEHNLGKEDVRAANLTRRGLTEGGVTFVVRPGDLIDLSENVSIKIDKKG